MTGHDPYAALRYRNVRLFLVGNLASIFGVAMQSTTVYWEIAQRTDSSLAVGLVGLVQALPVIGLALLAGHAADRFNRKRVIIAAVSLILISSVGLTLNSLWQGPLSVSYACLLANGVARAFQMPAKSSFFPQLVPREDFANAVTWNMGGFQLASTAGPALAGLLLARYHSPALIYALDAVAAAIFIIVLLNLEPPARVIETEPATLRTLLAGLHFVWNRQVLLGAMALDMFAVLLGGMTALLPIYQKILHVDAAGYGWMRAMPAVGALAMSLYLTHRPPMMRAGASLLWSVAGFGAATIVFGLSRSFALSLAMLFLTGALDMISVVVRHTLVQLLTPEEMRGRVSAVNGMFISASNELGAFESGTVAEVVERFGYSQDIGVTFSVVSGGIGTIAVVLFGALAWPQLRRYGRLTGPEPEDVVPESVIETDVVAAEIRKE